MRAPKSNNNNNTNRHDEDFGLRNENKKTNQKKQEKQTLEQDQGRPGDRKKNKITGNKTTVVLFVEQNFQRGYLDRVVDVSLTFSL